jgi:hypothetical protein
VGDHAVRLAEHASVGLDARQQSPAPARGDALGDRQALGVLLEALDAEELGADRVFEGRQDRWPYATEQIRTFPSWASFTWLSSRVAAVS